MSAVKHGKRKLKQMALEVAVRNPERYYEILKTFSKFQGKILDDGTILDVYTQLYLDKAVDFANNIDIETISIDMLRNLVGKQTHNNEWGYPTGYQAAFTRYLKTLSEFGFIYSQYNEPLLFSEIALAVVTDKISLSEAFAVQSMRFCRKSPYRRVLNDFNYFDFILKVIRNRNFENHTLSYLQFLLSLFSIDGNVDSFIKLIKDNKIGNDEDLAYQLASKICSENNMELCKKQTAFNDYGNTVFRVLQLTGFITVEHKGCLQLSFNNNRLQFYKELLEQNFSISENAKENELLYFKEIGGLSNEIFNIIIKARSTQGFTTDGYNEKLKNIIDSYNLDKETIEKLLKNIIKDKNRDQFWYMQKPLKFEFMLALYLYKCLGDEYDYKPNYKCDEKGIPYSHAPGNIGDIEIFNENRYWLIEATLIRNKNQQMNYETVNLFRHINDSYSGAKYLSLIAPVIHDDTNLTLKVATVITMQEKKGLLFSKAYSISEFISVMSKEKCIDDMRSCTNDFIRNLNTFLNSIQIAD